MQRFKNAGLLSLWFGFCLLMFGSLLWAGQTIHVGPEGSEHPYASIQTAIDDSADGDTILVYPGFYDENLRFYGKAITVRSEAGPETTIIDGGERGPVVVFTDDESEDSVIDGFTLTHGKGYWGAFGGGIFCENSASPTIINNIIRDNSACYYGGGISCYYGSSPLISGNIIEGNYASEHGGGIFAFYDSAPLIENNAIKGNTADDYGGGVCCFLNANSHILNNTITGNSAGRWGGGVFGYQSSPRIERNVILQNDAGENGGGIALDRTFSQIINCIIAKNIADQGGGLWVGYDSGPSMTHTTMEGNISSTGTELWAGFRSVITVKNSVVWNVPEEIFYTDSTSGIIFTYSNIQGGFPGAGNIDEDPLFSDPSKMDYHLTALSPCIDTASAAESPSEDFEGDPRPLYDGYDMGADEFKTQSCQGNFDEDGDVDGSDLAVFATDFGRTNCNVGDPCEGDFDSDNDVDGSDLATFATDFGRTDCPVDLTD